MHAFLTSRTGFTILAVMIVVAVAVAALVTKYGGRHGPGIYLGVLIGLAFLLRHIVGTTKPHRR
jgi:4-hydroxybenzoate polyprenyltransferase